MRRDVVSTPGAWGTVLLALVCATLNSLFFTRVTNTPDFGICLPSPDVWPLKRHVAILINLALVGACGIALSAINKRYSLIRGTDHILTPLFLLLYCSNPFLISGLRASSLLTAMTVLATSILFNSYKSRNATQSLFAIASFIGVGAMVQYSFLLFIPAVIISAIVMKCLGPKEILAFILGLIAPYWVTIGLGLVPLEAFRFPSPARISRDFFSNTVVFEYIVLYASMLIIGTLLALNNAVRLYAGNSRIRSENNVITIFGGMAIIGMIFDCSNISAYTGIFYLWFAVQIANLFALWNIRRGWILFCLILAIPTTVMISILV